MLKNKLFLLLLFLSTGVNGLLFGQMPLSKETTISILTCEKGNELYSLFGHTAIRIRDKKNALDVVYNYGTFDFGTENFYLKFIKGDLQYFVSACSFNEFYYEYVLENRSIYEQKLNLTEAQKQTLFDALNKSLLTEEKFYTYKFIDRNCTNMVVDKVNQTLGKDYIVKTTEKEKSYRQILFPYLENHFYENLGINIIFGLKVDQQGNRLFLPNQFMESLKVAKCNEKPIAEEPKTILKVPSKITKFSFWNNFYSFTLCILLIVVSRKKWAYLIYFSLLGLLGIFLSVVGFYSFHEELANNYNVLLFNPLLLLLILFHLKKKLLWVKRIAQVCLVSLGMLVVVLINKPNLPMFLPMIISSGILLIYFLKQSNKPLLSPVK